MPFLRKYNTLTVTGTTAIRIPIIKRGVVDFAVSADWTPAAGDVKIAIDGAAAANVTNLPTAVAMGNGAYWEFILTAAELTCKSCVVTVADSATKAVEDQAFIVETFGHASAMYPVDLSAAALPVNATQFAGQTITAAAGVTIPSSIASPTNITAATGIVLSGVTHTGAVIPTVSTVTNGVTVSTVSDKTGYSLTAGTGLGNQTANITGNLSGSVGSVTGAVELDPAARVKLHGTQDDYAPLKSSDYTAPLTAAATRTALGMSAADLDTQLDAILAAASAGAGTGARLVTITVNDGATVLQNAVVRLTEGGNTYRAITNVSGVATFNVDDATYSVAISKVGYSYAGTTIVVNGVETATYSMTAINVTPGSGDLTTGYLTCLDELGAAEADVSVRCQVVQIPSSGTGFAYDSTVQVETSAANGLVEFPMVKGCRYLIWRGSIKPPAGIVPVLISASAGSTTALGSLIGD